MSARPAPVRRPDPPSDAPRLRLSSPDDVLAAVPYLLGFHPERSLVVLGLAGPRGRLGVTMRMDLDAMPPGDMARRVATALQQDADDEAILLVYDPPLTPAPAGPPRADAGTTSAGHPLQPGEQIVAAVRAGLRRARIRVREALRVDGGRWWSYLCSDDACCPHDGSPVRTPEMPGGPSLVAATAVGVGMSVLPDRAALAAALEPPAPWVHAATAQALERLAGGLAAELGDPDALADRLLDRVAALRDRFADRRPTLSEDEVALVVVALHLLTVRDTVITWTLDDDGMTLSALLVEVVRRTPAPEHVPAATVLAWCSYLHGKGALAGVALELVAASQPDYQLALMVDTMLQNGIHPDRLRETTVATRADLRRRRDQSDQRRVDPEPGSTG